MRNAYEIRETYSREGKCLRRERAIGPIVPWAIVALATLLTGKGPRQPSGLSVAILWPVTSMAH